MARRSHTTQKNPTSTPDSQTHEVDPKAKAGLHDVLGTDEQNLVSALSDQAEHADQTDKAEHPILDDHDAIDTDDFNDDADFGNEEESDEEESEEESEDDELASDEHLIDQAEATRRRRVRQARADAQDAANEIDEPRERVRLQRVIADAGVAARRQAEAVILQGRVKVNGVVEKTLPCFVDPQKDRITVDGQLVPKPARLVYVMFHKPERVLITDLDEPGMDRRTIRDFVHHPAAPRLFSIGRLDYETTGLVLLTNDGDLTNQLGHPRANLSKTYHVLAKGLPTPQSMRELTRAFTRGERVKAKGDDRLARKRALHPREIPTIRVVGQAVGKATLEIVTSDERNLDLRGALHAAGMSVRKIARVGFGPLALTALPVGNWRELTRIELQAIRKVARIATRSSNKANGTIKPTATSSGATKPANQSSQAHSRTSSARQTSSLESSSGLDTQRTHSSPKNWNKPVAIRTVKAPKREEDAPMTRSGPAFEPVERMPKSTPKAREQRAPSLPQQKPSGRSSNQDSRKPDSHRPDSRKPDSRRPDSRKSDSRKPESRNNFTNTAKPTGQKLAKPTRRSPEKISPPKSGRPTNGATAQSSSKPSTKYPPNTSFNFPSKTVSKPAKSNPLPPKTDTYKHSLNTARGYRPRVIS